MSLAMADGAIDWSNLAIGDPQRNFVADDPADELLNRFVSSTDPAEQQQIAAELQMVFAEEVSAVPLVPLGGMGLVNTTRFTGFPTADNYYASAQPNPSYFADILLVLTQTTPK